MGDVMRRVLYSMTLDFGDDPIDIGAKLRRQPEWATVEELQRQGQRVSEVTIKDLQTDIVQIYYLPQPLGVDHA